MQSTTALQQSRLMPDFEHALHHGHQLAIAPGAAVRNLFGPCWQP